MEIDLLFFAVKKSDWREISQSEFIYSPEFSVDGNLRTFTGKDAEKIINEVYSGEPLLLIVLDPLRIQAPIKHVKDNDLDYINILGEVTKDALIDKIVLKSSKEGKYSLDIKHFD
ncbi:MAG: hypothetical protein U5K71_07255 [Gracilimonas sp.]|nr:hypothetical protein [Gracilimonas sp.]